MEIEELDAGETDRPAARLKPVAWLGIALACVVGGVLLVGRGVSGSEAPAAPKAQLPSSPIAMATPPGYGLGHNLVIGSTCPTFTLGPDTLAVSFEIANYGQTSVTLTDVRAVPPRGFRRVGPITSGGSCAAPGDGPDVGLLGSAETRLFTVRLRQPDCTTGVAAAPWLQLSVQQMVGTTSGVTNFDLGALPFTACPAG
jgi:hypothetical protein